MDSGDIKTIWKINADGLPLRMVYMLMLLNEHETGAVFLDEMSKLMEMSVGDISRYMQRGNVMDYFQKIDITPKENITARFRRGIKLTRKGKALARKLSKIS